MIEEETRNLRMAVRYLASRVRELQKACDTDEYLDTDIEEKTNELLNHD